MDNEFVKDFYALIPHFYKFVAKELSIKLTQNIDNTLDSIPVICQQMKINKFSDIKTYKGQHKRTYA